MGTTGTLDIYESSDGHSSWRLYEELFGSGVVYLELSGVGVELKVTEKAQTRLVLRLSLDRAKRLATANVTPANGRTSQRAATTDSVTWRVPLDVDHCGRSNTYKRTMATDSD